MPPGGKQYWIRTEQGRVWGPYPIEALERLRGQLTEKAQASLDGKEFRSGMDFPELRSLLTERKVTPAPPSTPPPPRAHPTPAAGMYVGPALMRPAAVMQSEKLELAEQGDLADITPVRLYALAAIAGANGWLELQLESGRMITVSFRRGTPDHVSSDDPELSLLRFLQGRKTLTAEQASQAELHATKGGVDVVSALFQLQFIPPADAHKLLGEHALFLLDRVIESSRGTFTFEKDAPSPPGAFALGHKWTLLAEAVRRLDPSPLRARLGKQLGRHVQRSGGSSIGKLEELALPAPS